MSQDAQKHHQMAPELKKNSRKYLKLEKHLKIEIAARKLY